MSLAFDLDRVGGRSFLRDLVSEVLAAGDDALALERDGAARRAMKKPDRSPVTEADEAVEKRLRAFLAARVPEADFVGEETGTLDRGAALKFIVDPIDGTRAFLRGLPSWTILLGLVADGIPSLGIALFPKTGDLLVAVRGEGATENGRPLRVSSIERLEDALVCHGALSQFHDANMLDVLPRLAESTYTQRGFADFEGYRRVLRGEADAMIDPAVQPWDICAAAVLIREAGGTFTGLDGSDSLSRGGLASNGPIHDELLRVIDERR